MRITQSPGPELYRVDVVDLFDVGEYVPTPISQYHSQANIATLTFRIPQRY